jgi:hypothetical protein
LVLLGLRTTFFANTFLTQHSSLAKKYLALLPPKTHKSKFTLSKSLHQVHTTKLSVKGGSSSMMLHTHVIWKARCVFLSAAHPVSASSNKTISGYEAVTCTYYILPSHCYIEEHKKENMAGLHCWKDRIKDAKLLRSYLHVPLAPSTYLRNVCAGFAPSLAKSKMKYDFEG